MTDLSTIAASAEKVVETIARVEPTVLPIAGAFIPGASPIIAAFQPFAPAIFKGVEDALTAIAAKNNGDLFKAAIELMQHLAPGMPNSPILSPPAATEISGAMAS